MSPVLLLWSSLYSDRGGLMKLEVWATIASSTLVGLWLPKVRTVTYSLVLVHGADLWVKVHQSWTPERQDICLDLIHPAWNFISPLEAWKFELWVWSAEAARPTCAVIVCLFVYVPTETHLGGKRDAIKARLDQTHTHTHMFGKGRKFALWRNSGSHFPSVTQTHRSLLENNDSRLKLTSRHGHRMLNCLHTFEPRLSEKVQGVKFMETY